MCGDVGGVAACLLPQRCWIAAAVRSLAGEAEQLIQASALPHLAALVVSEGEGELRPKAVVPLSGKAGPLPLCRALRRLWRSDQHRIAVLRRIGRLGQLQAVLQGLGCALHPLLSLLARHEAVVAW